MDLSTLSDEPSGHRPSVVPPYRPLRKVRLYDLANSPTSTATARSPPRRLNPNASPFRFSRPLNTANPFTEGYPSQTFQPTEHPAGYNEGCPQDSYYSPPSTFMPPVSPNELGGEGRSFPVATSASAPVRKVQRPSSTRDINTLTLTTQTRLASQEHGYKGVKLMPGQLGHLTMYGNLGHLASSTDPVPSRLDTNTQEASQFCANARLIQRPVSMDTQRSSSALNTTARNISDLAGFCNSPYSSDAEIHPSAGVSLGESDGTAESKTQHQTSTFPEQAKLQGIREWNNSVWDDRWLLKPEEMWNVDGRRQSILTVSPERQPSEHNTVRPGEALRYSDQSSRPLDEMTERIERLGRELEATKLAVQGEGKSTGDSSGGQDRLMPMYRNLTGNQESPVSPEQVPTPPDYEHLQAVVRDLATNDGSLPSGLPDDANGIRKHVYERVFGTWRPEMLSASEERKLTILNGKIITLGRLRGQIMKDIEDLVNYMVSPAGEEFRRTRAAKSGIAKTLVNRSAVEKTSQAIPEKGEAFDSQLEAVQSRDFRNNKPESSGGDASTIYSPMDRVQNISSQSITEESAAGKPGQILGTTDSQQLTFKERQHAIKPEGEQNVPSLESQGLLRANTASWLPGSTSAVALPSQTQSEAFPSMYPGSGFRGQPQSFHQHWLFQHQQHGAAQPTPHSHQLHTPYSQVTQLGNPTFMHAPAYENLAYQPPFVPADKYARAPAANRVASLYAQTNAWQPATQARQAPPNGLAQHTEWQNRFGTPATPVVTRDIAILPYRSGSDDMFPRTSGGASVRYQNLTRNQPPSKTIALDEMNVPFEATAKLSKPAGWGVMKIGNIPYDLTKSSIVTFLGNHAKIITPDLGPAIHITMDRATGKTQECFVEFFSTPDANAWVSAIRNRPIQSNRIGDRILEVELSCQDELLHELFPRAKNVRWKEGNPLIEETNEMFNSGFKNFISADELGSFVKHAEQPHRSNFTLKCPQRPYEAMISLISKFPWHATSCHTLSTRNQMFAATLSLLQILSSHLRRSPTSTRPSPATPHNSLSGYNSPSTPFTTVTNYGSPIMKHGSMANSPALLNEGLLRDLLCAGLNAKGFSEKQRWELYNAAEGTNLHFRVSPLAQHWPWEVLNRKAGIEDDAIMWYAQLISKHRFVYPSNVSPFGELAHCFNDMDLDNMTVEEMGNHEYKLMIHLVAEGCGQ